MGSIVCVTGFVHHLLIAVDNDTHSPIAFPCCCDYWKKNARATIIEKKMRRTPSTVGWGAGGERVDSYRQLIEINASLPPASLLNTMAIMLSAY